MNDRVVIMAVLMSLMMISVPFSMAIDSDAFIAGESGVMYESNNFSSEDLYDLADYTESDLVNMGLRSSHLPNSSSGSLDVKSMDVLRYSIGDGYKVSGNDTESIHFEEIDVKFKAKLVLSKDVPVPYDETLVKEGNAGLTEFLGTDTFLKDGILEYECRFSYIHADRYVEGYKDIDDVYCAPVTERVNSMYVYDLDVDVIYKAPGSSSGKEFSVDCRNEGIMEYLSKYRYDVSVEDLPTDESIPCTRTYNHYELDMDIDLKLKYSGKTEKLTAIIKEDDPPESDDYITHAYKISNFDFDESDILELDDVLQSSLSGAALKTKAESLGTISEGYDKVDSRIVQLMGDDDDDNDNKLVTIIAAVIVGALIVAAIVYVVVRKLRS